MQQYSALTCMITLLLLASCSNSANSNHRPDWIDNPGTNVVGQCGTHVKGLIAQEKCAYEKGLTYIAMSKGVSVDISANIDMRQISTEKTGSSYGQVQATVKVDEKNIKISASIIDKWHDKVKDIMYVLIEEN